MKLRSLGYRSDLIFAKFDGEISDRGSYLVVKTLTNPNYFWGNLIIFDRAPQQGDFDKWKTIFRTEFTDPRIYHLTFGWDSPDGEAGDISEFIKNGYTFEKSVVLTAQKVRLPKKCHPSVKVRPIESDQEWEEAIQVQLACKGENLSNFQWESFFRSQMGRYQAMVKSGAGFFFGAFLKEKLVACLGIFSDQDLGRYQIVSTHPEYQRQGICGSLVFHSAQYAFKNMGVKSLVMIADEKYHAAKIYETVGFKPAEKLVGLYWWDKSRG